MNDFQLYITSLCALAVGLIYMAQTASVIKRRRGQRIVHGDAGDKTMMKRIRGHANTAEQAPIFLILLGLVEMQSATASISLGTIAALFVIGRLMHGYYFLDTGAHHYFRMFGMMATLLAQVFVLLALLIILLNAGVG